MTKSTSTETTELTSDAATEEVAADLPGAKAEKVEQPAKVKADLTAPEVCVPGQNRYYSQLAGISGGLMVGLLALMTFLLTVGYSRPHANFSAALYASIGLLGANLVMPVLANLFRGTAGHKPVRIIQQIVFVASIVAVVCLALATANFFFAIPAAAAPVTQ